MATNSTQYANQIATPQVMNPSIYSGSQLRIKTAMITYAGRTLGEVYTLCQMPAGSRIVSISAKPSVSSGSTTIKIGDAANDAKFVILAAIVVGGALPLAIAGVGATDATAVVGMDAPYAVATNVIATTAAANEPGSGRVLFEILYVEDA